MAGSRLFPLSVRIGEVTRQLVEVVVNATGQSAEGLVAAGRADLHQQLLQSSCRVDHDKLGFQPLDPFLALFACASQLCELVVDQMSNTLANGDHRRDDAHQHRGHTRHDGHKRLAVPCSHAERETTE